jgi:hypothetical protein
MDAWQPYPKGIVKPGAADSSHPKLKGDAIGAEKTESASELIYWDGEKFVWYQQDD